MAVSDDVFQSHDDNGPSTSWDDGSIFDGQFDGGNIPSDGEELDNLVSQPRQVCLLLGFPKEIYKFLSPSFIYYLFCYGL